MSLKFGIYLVEQRIISPEQFCGLVKIQQDATKSIASIALRSNLMTIKQVARVLDLADVDPEKTFERIAMEQDLIDRVDADQLLYKQQMSCPSITKLVVECGLLTERQTKVLFLHFQRKNSNQLKKAEALAPTSHLTPPIDGPATPKRVPPRQPKFKQRPVVVRQHSQN